MRTQTTMMVPTLCSAKEIAEWLGVSRACVYQWGRRGVITVHTFEGSPRYKVVDVLALAVTKSRKRT